jgi:predicted RNA binding protein YcfA (HicA-like mRNA interferase family)
LKPLTGKEPARLLKKNCWSRARVSGSHHIYVKAGRIERISVPIHGNKSLKTGLLKHLLKIAGIEGGDST